MFKDVFQSILRFKNSLAAKYYLRKAVRAAIRKKPDAAYQYIKISCRLHPDDFSYVLLHGILAGIAGDTPVAVESCTEAFNMLERRDGSMRDVELEYLLTVATYWANHYSWRLNRSDRFKPIYEYYAKRVELKDVHRKWLYLFPAKFLDRWEYPEELDKKDGGLFSYTRRGRFPRYILGGLTFAPLIYVISGDYLYAVVGFAAGLLWVKIEIGRGIKKSRKEDKKIMDQIKGHKP